MDARIARLCVEATPCQPRDHVTMSVRMRFTTNTTDRMVVGEVATGSPEFWERYHLELEQE